MKSLFLLLLFCHVSSPVKHSLKFLYTASSGIQNLPDLMISVLVDDVQAVYCNSNKTREVNHDVWKNLLKDYPGLLDLCTKECLEIHPERFKSRLDRIMQHFNQTEGAVCSMFYINWKVMGGSFHWGQIKGDRTSELELHDMAAPHRNDISRPQHTDLQHKNESVN
ncbi:hypothetical protein EXN66_Car000271 [Channa argus]|uniref:Uncharacterized protein n=1 Tax=Channa argus TaxID=215402 RepID=A0A6G1QY09_CHAAH|nr:hypothetical protein EXN66_Car000271 [Channa argus]